MSTIPNLPEQEGIIDSDYTSQQRRYRYTGDDEPELYSTPIPDSTANLKLYLYSTDIFQVQILAKVINKCVSFKIHAR